MPGSQPTRGPSQAHRCFNCMVKACQGSPGKTKTEKKEVLEKNFANMSVGNIKAIVDEAMKRSGGNGGGHRGGHKCAFCNGNHKTSDHRCGTCNQNHAGKNCPYRNPIVVGIGPPRVVAPGGFIAP